MTHCPVLKVENESDVDERHASCGVIVGHLLYLWGGETEDKVTFSDSSSSEEDDEQPNEGEQPKDKEQPKDIYVVVSLPRGDLNGTYQFDVFDLTTLTWSTQDTSGVTKKDVPNLGNGSTLSYHKDTHSIYLYGGWNERHFSSDVYHVSMDTWKWEKIVVPEGEIKPSPRYLTGVLMYGVHLCNFGGVGVEIVENQDKGAQYDGCIEKNMVYEFGWNNEYYEFNTVTRKWEAPMSGKKRLRPPPLGGHTFTRFDSHRAICFGGRTEQGKIDSTYVFDLDKKEFRGPLSLLVSPTHRTFTTLCPLIDPDVVGESLCPGGPPMEQTLLLLWGKESPNLILKDCWLFHCKNMCWSKIDLGDEVERYWHTACSYFCQPGKSTEGQVVIYGGAKRDPSVPKTQFIGMRDLIVLSFGTKSLKNLCLSVIRSALWCHGLDDPEQLLSQLPHNIPTVTKQAIIKTCKAYTHVLS